jgi:1-acyl-sn-glycerol-3-phosphate acyltransferase
MSDTHHANQMLDEALVLRNVQDLVAELQHAAGAPDVRLDSLLDAELGLDSLALVELLSRLEHACGVELPDRILGTATTPMDLVDAVRRAHGRVPVPVAAPVAAPVTAPAPLTGDGPSPPEQARTLLETLAYHTDTHGSRVHLRILYADSGESTIDEVTYSALSTAAMTVAGGLHDRGLGQGDAVAIMLPTCRQYFEAFLGIVLAGGVPVPIYPPTRPSALEEHLRRQVHILDNAQATMLITDIRALSVARLLRPHVPSLRGVQTVPDLQSGAQRAPATRVRPGSTALIQYTSGSTGSPKGVVLTHAQVLANIRAIGAAARVTPSDVVVSWLPLYHDMGLIGTWFTSLYYGFPLVVMSPLAFLARPSRWLRAISDYGGTLAASPNFGYELCLRHVEEAEMAGVDLTSWRMACNGSEPVSPETMRRFSERFAPYGFRPEAMAPVYGLAEVGVALCFPPPGRVPVVDAIDRDTFTRSGLAVQARAGDSSPLHVVACGRPLPGYEVRVVDEAGHEVADCHEGHIECTGPSATAGYFREEAATRALRHGEWLDTGDLGYVAEGEIHLTGRVKDIIIRAGQNIHPDELEQVVGNLPGVRQGCVAVFASVDPVMGTERLVVLAETRLHEATDLAKLRKRITTATVDLLGTPPDDVVLAPPGTVLKTSSGKIRRAASRQHYETGQVGRSVRAPRWQIAHFAWSGLRVWVRAEGRSVAGLLYAAYVWALMLVVGVPTWILVLAMPSLRTRWSTVRVVGRALGRLAGVSLTINGDVTGGTGPRVVVANHGSFIDGLILILCLTEPATFVSGDEFASQHVAGPFLRRLGCEFVHRSDPQLMAADASRLNDILQEGRTLVYFPEGSLDRATGIHPFHLGAFSAAIAAGSPVIPIGIRGSRDVVRPGGRLPRRGAVNVTIGDPISPSGTGWTATLALRDEVRDTICHLSGEPDLG